MKKRCMMTSVRPLIDGLGSLRTTEPEDDHLSRLAEAPITRQPDQFVELAVVPQHLDPIADRPAEQLVPRVTGHRNGVPAGDATRTASSIRVTRPVTADRETSRPSPHSVRPMRDLPP